MRTPTARRAWWTFCGSLLLLPAVALAQQEEPAAGGPTREAASASAGDWSDPAARTPGVMAQYTAFETDFDQRFGVRKDALEERIHGVLGLKAGLDARWGDRALYHWIGRGLALYAQLQASTRMERRGFDFEVETRDMAEGKLGVRMTRPLGAAVSSE